MPGNLPIAIDLPFRVGRDGGVGVQRDIDRQVRQRLISIVGTEPGERVMTSRFGVPAASYVFEPDPEFVRAVLTVQVEEQAAIWEPGLAVRAVKPVRRDDGLMSHIDVEYLRTDAHTTPPNLSRSVHQAVIGDNGQIREWLRG